MRTIKKIKPRTLFSAILGEGHIPLDFAFVDKNGEKIQGISMYMDRGMFMKLLKYIQLKATRISLSRRTCPGIVGSAHPTIRGLDARKRQGS